MYETKQSKIDFIKALPEMIDNHKSDKDVYFYTVTFKEPKLELPFDYYREFFRYQRQRFDNALLSNSRSYSNAPFFILMPETNPYLHFHGFLCTHKNTQEKFQRLCIEKIENEYVEKLGIHKPSIRLKEKFIKTYSRALYFKNQQASAVKTTRYKNRTSADKRLLLETKPLLSIADYKLYPISNEQEFYAVSFYSNKKYVQSNFSSAEIILEGTIKSDKTAKRAKLTEV